MREFLLLAVAASAVVSSTAQAQTPPQTAPSPSANTLGGPVVAGVCLLSRQAVFANAKIGVAATERLRAITDVTRKEIEAARAPVETDFAKYKTEQAKLTDAQRQERQKGLSDRMKAVEDRTRLREREIEATRVKAMQRIAAEIEPVLAQVYKERGCGLLVDRNSVFGGNMTNDLTPAVVKGLDARVSTITFDRENLAPAPADSPAVGSN